MKDIIERHLKLGWICNSDHFVLTQAKDQPTLLFFTHANLFDLRQFFDQCNFLDPRQNFMEPHNPCNPRESFTFANHEPTHLRNPCQPRCLVDSYVYNLMRKFEDWFFAVSGLIIYYQRFQLYTFFISFWVSIIITFYSIYETG